MCGCKNSAENNERELYNKDVNVKHRFLFGVHISKDPDGIEGNVQIACGTIRKKKYERVANNSSDSQVPVEHPAQQLEDTLHDNG